MTFDDIYKDLEQRISPKRFRHICGVVETAEQLAKLYGADPKKARLAALLHDCAKEEPLDAMQAIVKVEGLSLDATMLGSGALLHGPAGAVLARTRYGVEDPDVLEAIRLHTIGQADMTLLDKVIFLADYIEPNRDFPGVDDLRKIAFKDLNQGVLAGYDMTIKHLIDQKAFIYEPTIVGRNGLLQEMQSKKHKLD